jgi:hypothetical protein
MKHLKFVKENYFKHMLEAWLISTTLMFASIICFIHSIFPFAFQRTASDTLKWILSRTNERHSKND